MRARHISIVGVVSMVFLFFCVFLLPNITHGDTNNAVTYLESKNSNPWITMALVSAGRSVDVSYLKSTTCDKAIDCQAPIMAITASGNDPRTYGQVDLVSKLLSFYNNNQIGEVSTVNDDIFGILSLVSAGVPISDEIIKDAKTYILTNQNDDGGWGWSITSGSDTNNTASAMMALLEAGMSSTDSAIQSAKAYLKSAQNIDGGFPYDPVSPYGTNSDSSSDAWVLSAIYAMNETPNGWNKNGITPLDHMLSLQDALGFFHYQSLEDTENGFTSTSTAYNVIALTGNSFPVKQITPVIVDQKVNVSYQIKGSKDLLCNGDINAVNALDVVINASSICNFTYNIRDTVYGPYLDTIGSDIASGVTGWMYTVNTLIPSIGANDYILKDDDFVLWYFSNPNVDVLQAIDTVDLKVNLIDKNDPNFKPSNDTIGFSLDIGLVNFGTMSLGENSTPTNIKLTNTGDVVIHVGSSVTGDNVFRSYLKLAGKLWREFVGVITPNNSQNISIELSVPNNYGQTGIKTGTLTFWATANN